MLPSHSTQEQLLWQRPIHQSIAEILQRRGEAVCVLASGDPLCYGIGATLLRHIPLAEMTLVPALSAFSLACARLGWAYPEVETLSLCGRDPALLNAVLYPGAQILVLSSDRHTPAHVAQQLTQQGYGNSQLTVLERMGGDHEQRFDGRAATWKIPPGADLNTLAIVCEFDDELPANTLEYASSSGYATGRSRLAGLPDDAYRHDGQITKCEVRAITLAALAPLPGQLLWDVGAGCGSISIEWLRSHARCRAIAIEPQGDRCQHIAYNAATLGTPTLELIHGTAPEALVDLPQPHAIFIGGGLTVPGVLETCWRSLLPGGRLVANAVTLESEQRLFQAHQELGGTLTRIAIHRTAPIGKFLGWKALAPITQWVVTQSRHPDEANRKM
jgi:precorrin-6Y C5,15-methyltransferase (decarboxylating)